MKITSLTLKNFRHRPQHIDLQNLTSETILTGANGEGKTTILNALRVLFVGHVYDQTGKRISNADLIGSNGKTAVVTAGVELAGKAFELQLTIKNSGTTLTAQDDRAFEAFIGADTATKIRAAIREALGLDSAWLECALNPRAYLLGPVLGAMLSELCGGDIEEEEVKAYAGDRWNAIEALAGTSVGWGSGTLSYIGEAAYKRRTAVKKTLAVAEQRIAEHQGLEQPVDKNGQPIPANKLQQLAQQINAIQKERDDLVAERGVVTSAGDPKEIEAKRAELENEIAVIKVDIAAFEEKRITAIAERDEAIDAEGTAGELYRKLNRDVAAANQEIEEAEAALAALEGEDGACPTCTRKYTAKLKETLCKPLSAQRDAAITKRDAIDIKGAAEVMDGFTAMIAEKSDNVKTYKAEIDDKARRLHGKELALTGSPDPAGLRSVDEINADIEALDAKIESGNQKLEALGKWSALEKARGDKEIYDLELDDLEWAIAAFRNGEFMKARLAQNKGVFVDACNAALESFGYTMDVEVDGKEVVVAMAKNGKTPAPLAQCSNGELVLAEWVVAQAVSKSAPICIDNIDQLYGPTKNIMLKSLAERDADAPLFLAGAWTAGSVDLQPLRAALPGATVVWVEGGEARTVGKAVAA